ncbi:hypothetical protein BH23BAC3_BH23BAC3_17960 [soil metagenome]
MKSIHILLALSILMISTDLFAQQTRFDSATDLLEEQQYSLAIDAYRSIADDGYVSGALWLNMGVAYAQMDSLGKAKYYLLRASQFPETEQLANESLDIINNRFSRRSAVLPLLPWQQFFEWIDNLIGSLGLLIAGLILLNIGAGFILASWFHPGMKKAYEYLSLITGGLAVLLLATSFYINLQNSWYGTGVTVERQTTVHNEPDTGSVTVSTAYEGYTLRVDWRESNSVDGWHYIRLENGLYGWIEEDAIMTF